MQAEFNQQLQKLAVDVQGVAAAAWEGDDLTKGGANILISGGGSDSPRDTVRGFLRAQANTIEGGTSNVMRNILGERVLGLPKEPDTSRELPWKEVPRSQ
jgi:alkylation response protein AidB-like acyl-CoA dehydrogenase